MKKITLLPVSFQGLAFVNSHLNKGPKQVLCHAYLSFRKFSHITLFLVDPPSLSLPSIPLLKFLQSNRNNEMEIQPKSQDLNINVNSSPVSRVFLCLYPLLFFCRLRDWFTGFGGTLQMVSDLVPLGALRGGKPGAGNCAGIIWRWNEGRSGRPAI